MRLTPAEFTALDAALRDAHADYDDLALTVRRTGGEIQDIVPSSSSRRKVVLALIEDAERRDQVPELIAAARAENPTNVSLLKLSAAIGLEPGSPRPPKDPEEALEAAGANLERMVDPDRGIEDLGSFAAKIQELLHRVCAVELGNEFGTGFLIGPDTILTNHHVVARAIDGKFDPASIRLRFDFQRLRDGLTTNGGVAYELADKWLVHASPHSAVDLQPYDDARLPGADELDYAVLRLRTPIGEQSPSGPIEEPRGWITPRAQAYEFPIDTFLMVVQHPCHAPISYDSADDAVIRLNSADTRVQYRLNTLGGSSGSPVLDRKLDLVALHHAGEPGSPDQLLPCEMQMAPAAYNEGVPIAAIQAHLAAAGHARAFGQA
jgi:V8-like Glu-specific endopeptidase